METISTNPAPSRGNRLLLVLITVFAGAVSAAVFPGLLMLPALWAFAMCRTSRWYLFAFAIPFAATAFLLDEPLGAACLSALAVGMAAVLYAMQTRKAGNAHTALALFGVGVVALYVMVCLPGILSGEGAFAAVQKSVDESIDVMRRMLTLTPGLTAEQTAGVEEYLATLSQSVPTVLVPILCMFSGVIALANLLFFHLFVKKSGLDVTPLRPFRLWAVPRDILFGLVVLLVLSIGFSFSEWEFAAALSATVNVLVSMPLGLQGLCIVDFWIVQRGRNVAVKRVLIYAALCIVPFALGNPLSVLAGLEQALIVISCFDQVFHMRERTLRLPPRPMA